jgi:hypothetical protein
MAARVRVSTTRRRPGPSTPESRLEDVLRLASRAGSRLEVQASGRRYLRLKRERNGGAR